MTQEFLDLSTIKALTLIRAGSTASEASAATGADEQCLVRIQRALAGVADEVIDYLAWVRNDTDALRRRIALHARRRETTSID